MITKAHERKYMETAVEEMYKSRSEHENKTDPMVGSILVKDGEIIAACHRGNYREGDHAEYTILERDLPGEDLEGSSIYVTLEPCTSRSIDKTPCAERIKQARIGRVVIGMPDPNPEIQGKGIQYLIKNDIDVDFFDHDLMKKIRDFNKDFIISMEEKGTSVEEFEVAPVSDYEKRIVESASFDDLDGNLIEEYLSGKNEKFEVPSESLWKYFEKHKLLDKENGEYKPTFAGLVLFGKKPADFFTQCRVTVVGHFGDEKETKDFNEGLISLPDSLKPMFQKYVRYYDRGKFKREKVPEFPEKAFREAVINAVAHRDYSIAGMRIIIEISPGKIVVKSPGLPLKPNDIEKIKAYNAVPYSRNPRVASVLNTMGYMEERGDGLNDIKDLLEEQGLKKPEFSQHGPYFIVKMVGPSVPKKQIEPYREIKKELNDRQKKMLDYIIENEVATSKDFEKMFEVKLKTIRRDLNAMVDKNNILERDEESKPKKYSLKE